jgi:hypothetical protein
MIGLRDALQPILSQPTPAALETLQGVLLTTGQQGSPVELPLEIAGNFHAFLSELQSKMSAKLYSEFASKMDMGAVGVVALENLLFSSADEFWQRLAVGGLAEGLMVAASRQYIKGWDAETGLVHSRTAWYLTEALWHTSCRMQPGLAAEQRWQAIHSLLAPVRDEQVPAPVKALLLGRIFQVLLVAHLSPLLAVPAEPAGGA